MDKTNVLSSLNLILGGLEQLIAAINEGEDLKIKVPAPAEKVAKKETVSEVVDAPVSPSELQEMKYNELKSLASKMELSTKGTKDELFARITGGEVAEAVDPEEEVEAEEEDDAEAEEGEETLAEQVERELAEMTEAEIADILESIGVSPKGKRQALLAKIVTAIEEGKLSLDAEEGDEAEEAPEEDEEEVVEADYLSDPTEARAKAMANISKELRASYKKKELTDKEISEGLADFFTPDEGYNPKLPAKEKLELYIQVYQRMVDDEGDFQDMATPYYINEESVCCGHFLKELEDGNMFCEVCGNSYETDEE